MLLVQLPKFSCHAKKVIYGTIFPIIRMHCLTDAHLQYTVYSFFVCEWVGVVKPVRPSVAVKCNLTLTQNE